jgi:DNA-binding NarL/FixJ family response regulator
MTTLHTARLSILVAAAAGIQRDALVSLLRAQPNMTVVAATGDILAVRRRASADPVHAIVLDGALGSHAGEELIAWLRKNCPAVRCIALADGAAQRQAFLAAGADDALLKGCLDEHLLMAVGKRVG